LGNRSSDLTPKTSGYISTLSVKGRLSIGNSNSRSVSSNDLINENGARHTVVFFHGWRALDGLVKYMDYDHSERLGIQGAGEIIDRISDLKSSCLEELKASGLD